MLNCTKLPTHQFLSDILFLIDLILISFVSGIKRAFTKLAAIKLGEKKQTPVYKYRAKYRYLIETSNSVILCNSYSL